MSEKQFVLYEHKGNDYILKNPRLHLDFIEMLGDALTNEEIVDKLNEQQDTISQLQDLCGKSDYENAKLRIENKKLKDDLHNCRLNKNIIREKLKLWQDVHKEHNIYNIKELKEELNNLKKDETMLYHYYTLARYGGDGV